MKEVIIIKEFNYCSADGSMCIIGVTDSIEKAEELIAIKYDDYMIVGNGDNQVFIEDASSESTIYRVTYDSYKLNVIE